MPLLPGILHTTCPWKHVYGPTPRTTTLISRTVTEFVPCKHLLKCKELKGVFILKHHIHCLAVEEGSWFCGILRKIPWHLIQCLFCPDLSRYMYGTVTAPNVLTNGGGSSASISRGPTAASFDLSSFYATPVYVDSLNLTLSGTTVGGVALTASYDITNPNRTLVRGRSTYDPQAKSFLEFKLQL